MRTLFVMDPLHSLNLAGDSTYMLMREASHRGWPVWWCTPDQLFAVDGRAWAHCQPVVTTDLRFAADLFNDHPLADFDLVWMRKDPPFDMTYIFTTYLLEMVPKTTVVLNRPASIRSLNEKLFAASFPDLTAPISCDDRPGDVW